MRPFDLEKALQGEPVRLRNGEKAYVCYKVPEHFKNQFKLHGYRETEKEFALDCDWNLEGISGRGSYKEYNIVSMWEEPRPQVTITIPAPLKEATTGSPVYYVSEHAVVERKYWNGGVIELARLQNGLCFETEADAKDFIQALKEARR